MLKRKMIIDFSFSLNQITITLVFKMAMNVTVVTVRLDSCPPAYQSVINRVMVINPDSVGAAGA